MLKLLNTKSRILKDINLMKIQICYLHYKHLKIFLFKFFVLLKN